MAVQQAAKLTPIPEFPSLARRATGEYNGMAYSFGTHMGGPGPFVPEINALAESVQHNAQEAVDAAEGSGNAQEAAEAARDGAVEAREGAEDARDASALSAANASGSVGAASGSASAASGSAMAAAGSATAASGSATAASTAKTGAEAARDAAQGYRDQAAVFATQQLKGSSTTSVTPGAGAKSFVIDANRSFVVGMYVVATSTSDPNTRMSGNVTSYNMGTGELSLSVDAFAGSAAKADWVIGVAAPGGSTSSVLVYVPVTGTTQAAAPGARYGLQNAAKTTVTLQASPVNGDVVAVICDNLRRDNVIARNGQLIMGLAEDLIIDNPYFPIMLQYQSPFGWRFIS